MWSVWLRDMIFASCSKGPGFDPDLCRVDFMPSLSTDQPWCQYNGLRVKLSKSPILGV